MGLSAYPTGADLRTFLEAAGLTLSDALALQLDSAAAAGISEFERRTDRRPMLAGEAAERLFDPPLRSRELHLKPTLVSLTSVSYQPTGATPITLVPGTDLTSYPLNAAADGVPITRLRFSTRRWLDPLWIGQRGSLAITGVWGYASLIPEDAWFAMLALGSLEVLPVLSQAFTGGIVRWTEKDRSEQYNADPVGTLAGGWQMRAERAVMTYRRVLI